MSGITQILKRSNGSEVKIVANPCVGLGLKISVDVHVHFRNSPDEPWKLASDRPHPDWRSMSVSEYVRIGRPEIYRVASIGEILKVSTAAKEMAEKSEGLFIVQ